MNFILALTLGLAASLPRGNAAIPNARGFIAAAHQAVRQLPMPEMKAISEAANRASVLAGRKAFLAAGTISHAAVHTGSTVMLLWTLAAIEAVKQEHHLAPLKEESSDWMNILTRAGEQVANNPALYASMIGAGTVGTLAALPLKSVQREILIKTPHAFTGRFLAGSAGSFVSFIGWEAGSRLWQEAIFNMALKDDGQKRSAKEQAELENDMKIALELRVMDVFKGKASAEHRRVFGKIMNNALEILMFTRPERTANWISNTFRLNIMNGEFFAILTSMTLAGTITGSVTMGPLIGTVVGFTGGVAAGLAAHYLLPEPWKRGLTNSFRNTGLKAGKLKLLRNEKKLDEALTVYAFHGESTSPAWLDRVHALFEARGKAREGFGSVIFMQVYDWATRFQTAEFRLMEIEQRQSASPDEETLKQLKSLREEYTAESMLARNKTEKFLKKLFDLYASDIALLDRIESSAYFRSVDLNLELISVRSNLNKLTRMLEYFSAGLFIDARERFGLADVTDDELPKVAAATSVLLNQFYVVGFSEALLKQPSQDSK